MFKWLSQILSNDSAQDKPLEPARSSNLSSPEPARRTIASIPVYPPADEGIPVVDVEDILESQNDLLKKLRILAGGDETFYQTYFLSVIRNLAAYVQLLPASQTETHMGAGGLFRLCFEVGFYSMQRSESVLFDFYASIENRRLLEPCWRYATFIAGLGGELQRVITDMNITNDRGEEWPKYLLSLTDWANKSRSERYFVHWSKTKVLHTRTAGRADVSILLTKIVPDVALQYMQNASVEIIPVLYAVASGASAPSDSHVAKIVSETRDKILKRDSATRISAYGRLTVGNHIEPHLLDAMRVLITNGTWKVNEHKARLWSTKQGLFLIWKSAARELSEHLAAEGLKGIPKDYLTLAEMLCQSAFAVRNGKSPLWLVKPPQSVDTWQALKVADPLALLQEAVAEVDIEIVADPMLSAESVKPVQAVIPGVEKKLEPSPKVVASENTNAASNQIVSKTKPSASKQTIDSQRDLLSFETEMPEPVTSDDDEAPPPLFVEVETPLAATPSVITPPSSSSKPVNRNTEPTKNVPDAASRRVARDTEAEIMPAVQTVTHANNVSEFGRGVLKPDVLEAIGKMIADYRAGDPKKQIFDVPHGIAFELIKIQSYGLSNERLLGVLHANEWLVVPETNRNSKLMKIPGEDGKNRNCVVIRSKAAELLGFYEVANGN